MRICIYEDGNVLALEPLTLTRPAFDLCCGRYSLLQRQRRYFGAGEVRVLVRDGLAEFCRFLHPDVEVGDPERLSGTTVLVNARWLPGGPPPDDLREPRVALVGDQVAYAVLRPRDVAFGLEFPLHGVADAWKHQLPQTRAGGWMIDYPWNLVEHNREVLEQDYRMRSSKQDGTAQPLGLSLIGPADRLVIDPAAEVEPCVVVDTRKGPVFLDRDVVVQAFTRLEGPCHIGAGTQVFGAKIKGSSIGPMCRVGGEVEASIIHGYSNKYHDGFLGHSYVGEWVNLAAGTQTSDLRNDYGPIPLTINQRRLHTGMTKVGAFIGDHTKTALGSLLNTGTVVGAFCNLLPAAGLLPKVVPSFCTVWHGQVREVPDVEPLFKTAATVMERRGCEFTEAHAAFYRSLYQDTAGQRHAVLHGSPPSRLRTGA